MKTVLLIMDTLNRAYLPAYGDTQTIAPNFQRLQEKTMCFENFYCCSMPCMPARREMHTGRPNFLHRSWSPLEPFDSSVIRDLKETGIYTHMITDHYHYWEVGGYGYLNQYNSMEMIRGQQGDLWIPFVGQVDYPPNLSKRAGSDNFNHDWVNRQVVKSKDDLPTAKVFAKGLDFLEENHGKDDWFLTMESFSPHEPFFTTEDFLSLYPEEDSEQLMDWPDYGKNNLSPEITKQVVRKYRAMISMVDFYLGKVLDCFDKYNLWDSTALIVYTDHGFLLGEHECLGKNIMSPYEELTHLPFFMHDPRYPAQGTRVEGLAQSLSLAPTIADLFSISAPKGCINNSLKELYKDGIQQFDSVIFGVFGAQIGITDGRYVLFKSPKEECKGELYNYTLSPQHMRWYFSPDELKEAEFVEVKLYNSEDTETQNLLKIPAREDPRWFEMEDQLFDLVSDPEQKNPIEDASVKFELEMKLRNNFLRYNAPDEMYPRFGLKR